ncbi:hypothetical protein HN587_06675 [Candidatus Woesearchaeota archaeon]|jgi:hypothetical protein|nr:hypothetical protein [Candidatus Woesearchaeota archaeon]
MKKKNQYEINRTKERHMTITDVAVGYVAAGGICASAYGLFNTEYTPTTIGLTLLAFAGGYFYGSIKAQHQFEPVQKSNLEQKVDE